MRLSQGFRALGLCLLLAGAVQAAELYKAGGKFDGFSVADQHGNAFTYKPGACRFVIFEVAGEAGSSSQPRDPNWFDAHRAVLVVDISGLSSFKRRIARSRMEAKSFRILAVEDADLAGRFPREKDKFTVLTLDDQGLIASVQFASAGKELQDLVETSPKPLP